MTGRTVISLLVPLALALLVACGDSPKPGRTTATEEPSPTTATTAEPTATAELGRAVHLRAGNTWDVAGTSLSLRFLGVSEDSRCPIDVTCVWAGEAILVFSALGATTGSTEFALRLAGRGVASIGDYLLIAEELLPEPHSGQAIAAADYQVTLTVEPMTPAAGSGITGLVTVGPQCPVIRAGEPCPDRPYAGTLVVSDGQGIERGRVTADGDGRYSLALPPGSYRVQPLSPPGTPLPRASAVDVLVPAGWVIVRISYDSGIR